jgi:hypothetical protein
VSALPEPALPFEFERLAAAMVAVAGRSGDNFAVDAGYTYLGQFIDHDVTLNTRAPRVSRSPLLDLDSVYGVGPRPGSPLYGHGPEPLHGARLRIGGGLEDGLAREDLPRDDAGHALIGDPRNDENLIVSQLHLLFLRFHNRVVEHVAATEGLGSVIEVFVRARQLVRWHFQWLVVHDFLPKVVGEQTLAAALAAARPVASVTPEFAAAAFRFGHSMVREDYRLNAGRNVPLFRPRGETPDPERTLAGDRRLPVALEIDWQHFFRVGDASPQRSKLIDVSLSTEFDEMPGMPGVSIARLDLGQGLDDGLPAANDLAGGTPLTPEELLDGLGELDRATRGLVLEHTPLWYFVLAEAQARGRGGTHLGPVGGRIVADQLIGLLLADEGSYLRAQPGWTPDGVLRPSFTSMPDFVAYALGGSEV